MGIIEDLMSVVRKGPELASQLDSLQMNRKSIIRGANDATFQFPILITDTIPIDMANTFARTMDRVYASFTQTWISLHPFMDISLDPTPLSYLRKLHQNMSIESVNFHEDEGALLDRDIQEAYAGETICFMNKENTFGIVFSGTDKASKNMLESHRRYLTEHMKGFDFTSVVENNREESTMTEAESDGTNELDLTSAFIDSRMNQIQQKERETRMNQTRDTALSPKLMDRDVKKSNDMVPFGIQVRLIAKNEKNEFVQYIDFVLGVKAVLHPVRSDDMINNIQRVMQNKSIFFKFLRWTTGEISLVKNILFDIDEIKLDAKNRQAGKSPWFGTLRRLKNKKIGFRNFTVPHKIIPNATIVISSVEADYLESACAVYVRNPKIAKRIMNGLFLVAFVIVDDTSGTIDILYDGSDSYQTYALETLERENSMASNKLGREIGRMIAH